MTLCSPFLFRKEMGKSPALRSRFGAGSWKAGKTSRNPRLPFLIPQGGQGNALDYSAPLMPKFRCGKRPSGREGIITCTGIKRTGSCLQPTRPSISEARIHWQAKDIVFFPKPPKSSAGGWTALSCVNFGARKSEVITIHSHPHRNSGKRVGV